MSDSLRVLIIPPGHPPELRTIPHTLEALQACVGGDLECWAIEDHVAIYCNEEGRLRGLPYNRRLTLPNGTSERFVGPILLTGFRTKRATANRSPRRTLRSGPSVCSIPPRRKSATGRTITACLPAVADPP